jgi:hypothetical protein
MKKIIQVPNRSSKEVEKAAENDPPGYPFYPDNEDIYQQSLEEMDIDPEDTSQRKKANEDEPDGHYEADFDGQKFEYELDVPGAELDDESEAIGNEDEENNYYSLGSENHDVQEDD